jgi:hypothetical protein
VQFVTARLYQGQTTNFHTPGGGFATVFTDISAKCAQPKNFSPTRTAAYTAWTLTIGNR